MSLTDATNSSTGASSGAAIGQAPPEPGAGAAAGAGGGLGEEDELPAEPYYWEEGGNPDVDWWAKVRHTLHFGGVKAIAGAETVGEVVANTLGLNDSKYQYVIDALEADKVRREIEERDEEDRRQMELEEEAASRRVQQERANEEASRVASAIELGDTRVSFPESDEIPIPLSANEVTH